MTDQTPGQQLMDKLELDEKLSLRTGIRLAETLDLKGKESGRFKTGDGHKTWVGLARLVARILAEEY